jgi:hypothetical protein
MKYFWCLLVISILYSCETINPEEEIPSFLFIDDVELETSSTQGLPSANITDVWVYTADEFLGVFPLPAKVPVLADGSSDIIAVAGIKKNGITASRLDYPFFSQYNETVELNRNEICSIMPIVNYTIDEFPLVENFEGNGSIFEVVTDSLNHLLEKRISTTSDPDSSKYAIATIRGEEGEIFECNSPLITLPKDRNVYLEFEHKGNSSIVVGFFAYESSVVNKTSIIYLNPSTDWNKIYLSLTESIYLYNNATEYKLFFGMVRDVTMESNSFYLDNIRLVYEE